MKSHVADLTDACKVALANAAAGEDSGPQTKVTALECAVTFFIALGLEELLPTTSLS